MWVLLIQLAVFNSPTIHGGVFETKDACEAGARAWRNDGMVIMDNGVPVLPNPYRWTCVAAQ